MAIVEKRRETKKVLNVKMKKKKINKKNIIILILMLIFATMFIVSTIKIVSYLIDNKENRQIQKNISKAIMVTPSKEDKYTVDFNLLKKENSNTIAYLKVNGTNIDYIVVKGNDNNYYLNHNFNNKVNVSGWIFADYRNKFDGNDKNIIIYGHNTMDGSMFGTLKNVLTKDWNEIEENKKIMLVTSSGIDYYKVFSVYTIEAEDYYTNTSFKNDDEYEDFLKRLRFRSIYSYEVNVSKYDRILTLSTCTPDGKNRVVLHAKLMNNNS